MLPVDIIGTLRVQIRSIEIRFRHIAASSQPDTDRSTQASIRRYSSVQHVIGNGIHLDGISLLFQIISHHLFDIYDQFWPCLHNGDNLTGCQNSV